MAKKPKPPSPRQVLLGLFIVGQIVFLVSTNLLGFATWFPSLNRKKPNQLINRTVPRFAEKQGNLWHWIEQYDGNLRRWTELTGQEQGWSLFAPTISKETAFPAVLLSWDEPFKEEAGFPGGLFSFHETNGFHLVGDWNHPPEIRQPSLSLAAQVGILAAQSPWETLALAGTALAHDAAKHPRMELLLSENEPRDLHHYFRVSHCRVRKFEGNFYVNPQPYPNEGPDGLATRLTARMREFTDDYNDLAVSYLRWRLKTWQANHPDEPAPRQVILVERFFRLHGPKEDTRGWDGPYVVPIARWLPEGINPDRLEPFDFGEQRFFPKAP